MFLVDSFVAGASKTQEEIFTGFYYKNRVFRRDNEDKDFKHNKNKIDMQKYHQVNTLKLEKYRGL